MPTASLNTTLPELPWAGRDVIRLGCVAYDPKAVTIWEVIKEYFLNEGVPMDFVLFSNYESQLEALLEGVVDIAWNTPLAHVKAQLRTGDTCLELAMRDVDATFASKLIVRTDAGIESLHDLHGKTLALGSADSPQAAILPVHFLAKQGVDLSQVELLRFNTDVGKHGDTGTSELDVLKALADGKAHAGTVGDATWIKMVEAGQVNTKQLKAIWTSPTFSHCCFTALGTIDPGMAKAFTETLLKMDYNNPQHRHAMDLEGCKAWLPGRKEGYECTYEAIREQNIPLGRA